MIYSKYLNKREKGFTLLEVMITMVIIAIGLLALAKLLITNINTNRGSELRMQSSAAIEMLLEEAAIVVKADQTACQTNMTLSAAKRAFVNKEKNYELVANCSELLGPGGATDHQDRYLLEVQIWDVSRVAEPPILVKQGTTIVTTAVSEL